VLASFFLAAYVGLAVPVVAFGTIADFISTSALMTIFATAASAGLADAARRLRKASAPVAATA
jgi:hypothetical protein